MPEYLDNPRRVPRDPIRCRAQVAASTGTMETATEDLGARGCQVVLPTALERGAVVALTLSAPRVGASLRLGGRVAWVSPRPPWRVGIAFTPECLGEAARWMETLRHTTPELFGTGRRLHEKVAVDAMVFLGVPPRLADFGDDEVAVLRKVWAGVKVAELRASFAGRWPRMQRSFFALLAQGYLTLSRAASAHPVRWREILGEPRPVAPPTILTAADLEPDPEPIPLSDPAELAAPPEQLDTPYGAYVRSEAVEGRTLVRTERIEVRRNRVPPERAGDFAAFAAAVDSAQARPLVLAPVRAADPG